MPLMSIAEAKQRTDAFLSEVMPTVLSTIDYAPAPLAAVPSDSGLSGAARARVLVSHVRGASDATYRIAAFGEALDMQLQLNVWRLVVVYKVPADGTLDASGLEPRLRRWQAGAEHAGWTIGWRDAVHPDEDNRRLVETYCYARTGDDFLANDLQQLFWRTDIVQMTRYFILEAKRCGIALAAAA